MVDTHCHLTFPQYDADREQVLQRAADVGVRTIINPGTDLAQSRAAVALASASRAEAPTILAAVGVHPQDVGELSEEGFQEIAQLAHDPHVVAVGEVGLERSARSPSLDVQISWLTRFLQLASDVQKPMIFHVRGAHAEFRAFLETHWGSALRSQQDEVGSAPRSPAHAGRSGVVHCFSGSMDDARWYTERGLFLGMTGIVTFPNAEDVQTIVRDIALDHLLLETDAPFLAPQSHRGKRNEPAYVREAAETIARLQDGTVEDVEHMTDQNADILFKRS